MTHKSKPTAWQVREDGRGWILQPVRQVGKRTALSPPAALRWNAAMLRLSPLCGRWFPPGVFKFKTWEEERAWTQAQINRAMKLQK